MKSDEGGEVFIGRLSISIVLQLNSLKSYLKYHIIFNSNDQVTSRSKLVQ